MVAVKTHAYLRGFKYSKHIRISGSWLLRKSGKLLRFLTGFLGCLERVIAYCTSLSKLVRQPFLIKQ